MNARTLWIAAAAVLIGCAALSLRPGPNRWRDGQFLHVAGKVWLQGESPYRFEAFHAEWRATVAPKLRGLERSFVYPPTSAVLALPLGALPYDVARTLYDVLSLLALVGSAILTGRLLRAEWTGPATLIALSVSSWQLGNLFLGQTGLLALVGVLGAIWAHREGRPWLGALAVVVASIKPQLSALPLLALLVMGGWRPVLYGAAFCAGVSVLAVAPAGLEIVAQLEDSLARHLVIPFNRSLGSIPIHAYALPALVPLAIWGVHFELRRSRVLSAYRRRIAVDGRHDRPWDAFRYLDTEEELIGLGETFPSSLRKEAA